MDTIEFAKSIPAEKLAEIFKDYFEQHMAVYYMLKGIEFITINADISNASIIYSIKILDDRDKDGLTRRLQESNNILNIYGKEYKPEIFLNGDLLCITINK